jgi:methylenetetrahydrofolate dehydrogenase (NADP+)/methenyltetrahydrofolate cyclohydrolase
MGAIIIDGQAVAAKVKNQIASKVAERAASGKTIPGITVILVGSDPASEVYVNMKEKAGNALGMRSTIIRLAQDTSEQDLLSIIYRLNKDPEVHGILVQLPLPSQINEMNIISSINPIKDVDGFHPFNVGLLQLGMPNTFVSCTPMGIMRLLEEYGISPDGKRAVVVGRSNIVGKPMATLLTKANATVTVCHSRTVDLPSVCREADILVVAIGRAKMITDGYVRSGAVVIDVGTNHVDGKLCGDVDFDAVKEKASAITPVPKGVGPMTIAMLMQNTFQACERLDFSVSRETLT